MHLLGVASMHSTTVLGLRISYYNIFKCLICIGINILLHVSRINDMIDIINVLSFGVAKLTLAELFGLWGAHLLPLLNHNITSVTASLRTSITHDGLLVTLNSTNSIAVGYLDEKAAWDILRVLNDRRLRIFVRTLTLVFVVVLRLRWGFTPVKVLLGAFIKNS